jgi:hypothetical protein
MMSPLTPFRARLILAALCAGALPAAGEGESVQTRLTLRGFTDFGQVVHGSNPGYVEPELEMQPLQRAGVTAIQEAALGNFDVAVGLTGLIWWPYGGGITDANERDMTVRPMVPMARVRWRFGAPAATSGALLVGTFAHKYNPDAKNLGEYLYRSGTYPGYLWTTEGWLLMNRASQYSHGAMLSASQFGGALKHNLNLFMSTSNFPVGNFSPGYDVSLASKWLELGGGVVLNHFLALRPSQLRPSNQKNLYVHASIDTAPGRRAHYYGPDGLTPFDASAPTYRVESSHYWTHRGVKLMGRAALNLNPLLPAGLRGPEDGRVFGEVALLGVENQPLFYEKRSERMPVMLGVNVPAFKLLDLLCLQAEYYAAPFNNIADYQNSGFPVWTTEFAIDTATTSIVLDPQGRVMPERNHRDDWKWSVIARKEINRLLTVHAQAASDHLRLTDGKFNPSTIPLTGRPSEWYYLLRLEFALR